MNKQEAMERLDAMAIELDALKAVIEAPAHDNILDPDWLKGGVMSAHQFVPCPSFEYRKAVYTLIELRTMDGTTKPEDVVTQYVVCVGYHNHMLVIEVDTWFSEDNKLNQISPCFRTEDQALAAIQKIGEDRLMHMFKTLHGVV